MQNKKNSSLINFSIFKNYFKIYSMTTKTSHIGKISIGIFALSYYMKNKKISIFNENLAI